MRGLVLASCILYSGGNSYFASVRTLLQFFLFVNSGIEVAGLVCGGGGGGRGGAAVRRCGGAAVLVRQQHKHRQACVTAVLGSQVKVPLYELQKKVKVSMATLGAMSLRLMNTAAALQNLACMSCARLQYAGAKGGSAAVTGARLTLNA